MPEPSLAADTNFIPQVTIGDFKAGEEKTPSIAQYIKAIYAYAIGIVGILAAVVLMFGGVLWITAGGNNERISNAKSWIAASLSGLVLALCSYMILFTINPNLTQFKDIAVKKVEITNMGRCITTALPENRCEDNITKNKCLEKQADNIWEGGETCPTRCCAYGGDAIKTAAAQTLCRIQYPLHNCLFTGIAYENCVTQTNMTKASCNDKAKFTDYVSDGTCVTQTLPGSSTYYRCQAK